MIMNNVVLTACTDYQFSQIAYFIDSFCKYVSDCELVIIGARLSSDTLSELRDRNVTFVDIDEQYLPVNRSSLRVLRKLKHTPGFRKYYPLAFNAFSTASQNPEGYEYALQGIQSFRYRHYRDYISENYYIENVALLDIRDIVFQSDLFERPCTSVEFGLEEGITVESDSFNHRWLATIAGKSLADSFIGQEVSCSGATFGPKHQTLAYLDAMDKLLSKKYIPLGPTDQGAHNFIRFKQMIAGIEEVPNRTRRVQNMQGQTTWVRKDKFIVDLSDNITPVIHQYDRHSELTEWPNELLA